MNSKRLSLATAAVLAVIGAFGASAAQANTYCANKEDVACSINYTNLATAVQSAVNDAKNNPGPDTVLIGTGNFVSLTPMDLSGSGTDNQLTIIGSGPGTVLSVADQENPGITFDAGAGSSMRDLTYFINASATNTPKEGLVARNSFDGEPPTISNVTIYSNPNPNQLSGVVLYDGSDLEDSSVDVSSANYYTVAVKADGGDPSEVTRSYLAANTGAVQNSTNGELILDRVEIRANGHGARNGSGVLRMSNSLIELSSGNAQRAIYAQASNTGPADTYIEGSTIVANAGSGIVVEANQGASSAKLVMRDSVLAGAAGTGSVSAANAGDSVTIEADRVAVDSTKYTESGSGTIIGTLGISVDLSETSPGFANAGAGDYRLAAGSALIDAGRSEDPPPGALDHEGNPRACHGTDDGVIRRDIGAFEFKTVAGDDCTYPDTTVDQGPAVLLPGARPAFAFGSTKTPATFLCSWDGQAEVACANGTQAPDLGPGAHDLSVRARDQYGNIDQTPATIDYEVQAVNPCDADPSSCNPDPTCETDPSLCPPPGDTTAPKVTGLKVPKKTKAARVKVRFKSNEAGVTFTCKLNKAKAKRCKSPWKTPKLKKGKNTIAIQATDKAGNKSKIVKRVIRKLPKRK